MDPSGNHWRIRAQRTGRRLKHLAFSRLYQDRYRDLGRTVFVAGMARSGTTWLGSIIASQGANRLMYEPFNPWPVGALHSAHYILYKRPDDEDAELADFCSRLFSGDIRHSWIDRHIDHLLPEGRVVKAVRANLMLGWLRRNFPEIPQVLIIRHPCAVVASWLKLGWTAERDIASLLKQPELVSEFLIDKLDIIGRVETDEEKYAIIWCISNLVPLSQFLPGEIHITFYEHMCTQPEVEIPRLFHTVNRKYQDSVFDFLIRPSTAARPNSAAVTGQDRVTRWQQKLSTKQVDRILSIVEAFGLDYLYGDSSLPTTNRDVLMELPSSHPHPKLGIDLPF